MMYEIISRVFLVVDGVNCWFKYSEHMMKFGSYNRSIKNSQLSITRVQYVKISSCNLLAAQQIAVVNLFVVGPAPCSPPSSKQLSR
jgi:hypothetical protein